MHVLLQLHKETSVFDIATHANRIVKSLDLGAVHTSDDPGLLQCGTHT